VRATIDLAHALDFTVVAEGIEDEETLGIVRELGVDLVQGFQIARPLVPADATRWLRRVSSRHRGTGAPCSSYPRSGEGGAMPGRPTRREKSRIAR